MKALQHFIAYHQSNGRSYGASNGRCLVPHCSSLKVGIIELPSIWYFFPKTEIALLLLIAGITVRFLWWHRIVNEIQLYYLQDRTTSLRCSSGLPCSIQSMQLPVAARTLPLRLSSVVVSYLKVTHNFCSEEKGSKAAPSTFLCTIYKQQVWERGWWVYVSGATWHSPVTLVQEERGHGAEEEEVTRNHKWEKLFIKQVQPFPCERRILISSSKIASSFWFLARFCPSYSRLLVVYCRLSLVKWHPLCVLCSAGWDMHAALSKLTRTEDVNEQNIKDYGSLQLGVKLTSSSDFEAKRLQVLAV